jgi:Zn-dependent M28 family amino/carboxypeptidase
MLRRKRSLSQPGPRIGESVVDPAILEPAVRAHVDRLARDIGERNILRPPALEAAREYITGEWRSQGYQVRTQWYDVGRLPCANVEVTRHGSSQSGAILLVGAHYDSISGSPGADDNASGVAALLELSHLFSAVAPRATIRFVAFANEEWPFFLGSQQGSLVYARNARLRGDDIRLMISLETIGYYSDREGSQSYPPLFRFFYPDKGNFVGFVSDYRSARMMRRLARLFRAGSDFPLEQVATFRFVPGVSWSDHLSFWRAGFRAFMVTDTAFYRYPFYHSADDTPEKLTYPQLARVTAGLFLALLRMSAEDLD